MAERTYETEPKPRVYIAGPMRGAPGHIVRFLEAATLLRSAGFLVVSPLEINHEWHWRMESRGLTLGGPDFMRRDIPELLNCSAMHLLPGWQSSVGTRCEVAIALTLGFKFVDRFGDSCDPPSRVVVEAGGYDNPPGVPNSLDDLREESIAFANRTFGSGRERRPSIIEHLKDELIELGDEPNDVEEMADVFLLLAHLSDGVDLAGAVRAKLTKNLNRTWGKPDERGVVRHTAEGVTP